MSRGVVLWPDHETSERVRGLWDALADADLPSCSTHTHGLHQPHVSLSVADELPVDETLAAVGVVPSVPIRLRIESIGMFPGGVLMFPCVPNTDLLWEQQRVHGQTAPLATGVWPFLQPGEWMPHITCGWELSPGQMAAALSILTPALPIHGWLDRGGVEDGTTGENWPALH